MTDSNMRNKVIDISKGIAIYLVVLGHLQIEQCNIFTILIASCFLKRVLINIQLMNL